MTNLRGEQEGIRGTMEHKRTIVIVGIMVMGLILFMFVSRKWDSIVMKEIHTKIESLGGTVTDIQKIAVEKTPFKKDNVGGEYFKIEYELQGEAKIAYYRRHKSLNIEDIPSRGAPEKWIME